MKPKIVFVVGHENWGKSHTLRFLTNGNWRVRSVRIGAEDFYIRRMSNDDRPDSYVEFMNSVSPQNKKLIIAALCPNFERQNAKTESILKSLNSKGYQLFFWVMQHQYGTEEQVKTEEIQRLKTHGTVELFSSAAEAKQRAALLRTYIETRVVA